MKKRKNLLILLTVLAVAAAGFCVYKLILHEKDQNENLDRIEALLGQNMELSARVSELSEQLGELSDEYRREKEYYRNGHQWGEGYNWLALGNSLTLIETYGRGICSTREDNDYVALVQAYLEKRNPEVDVFRYNYVAWEQKKTGRSSKLYMIDSLLSPAVDLVTIQLGENVADRSTYREDLTELINHIKAGCPEAEIIMIDDFWTGAMGDLRKEAAQETGIGFADLSGIRGKKEYQSKAGTVMALPGGKTIKVSEEAETHPGDAGMEYIANQVIAQLEAAGQ